MCRVEFWNSCLKIAAACPKSFCQTTDVTPHFVLNSRQWIVFLLRANLAGFALLRYLVNPLVERRGQSGGFRRVVVSNLKIICACDDDVTISGTTNRMSVHVPIESN
jgi:hypothetical protein